jgi:hypothetical protein
MSDCSYIRTRISQILTDFGCVWLNNGFYGIERILEMNWREAALVFVLLVLAIAGILYFTWLTRRLVGISERMWYELAVRYVQD